MVLLTFGKTVLILNGPQCVQRVQIKQRLLQKKSSATPSFIDRQNQTSAGDSDSQFFNNIGPQGHHTCKLLEGPHKQGQI